MAVLAEERARPTIVEVMPAADPAPLGLAAFALTTFILSGHNASFIPDVAWLGLAFFYGGLVQLLAGMWEFRNRNVFGATAFSTYGGFWMALGFFVTLVLLSKSAADAVAGANLLNGLAWFLLAFAIFNFYMLLWSTRVNVAVFGVFLTLQITEVLLTIGFFNEAGGGSTWITHAGGWAGIVTAAVAWYASAAGVVNGMSPERPVLPVGSPLWGRLPLLSRMGSPMPRRVEA
jgi:succinate-acetate transporter protein